MSINKEIGFSNEHYEEYYYQLENLVSRNEYWWIFCGELHNHINCHPKDYEFTKLLNSLSREKTCDLLSFFEASEFDFQLNKLDLTQGIRPYFFKEPKHSKVVWEIKDEYNLLSTGYDEKNPHHLLYCYIVSYDKSKNKWSVIPS